MTCAKANILFLLKQINYNDGIASYCQVLAEGLRARGASVFLVCGQAFLEVGTEIRRDALNSSVDEWHEIEGLGRVPDPYNTIRLSRFIKDRRISVVNVHGLGMLSWGKVLSMTTGANFVATYHPSAPGGIRDLQSATKPFTVIQRMFLRAFCPEKLIVLSEESKTFLLQQCTGIANTVITINGGIDNLYFRPPSTVERLTARTRLSLNSGDLVCLTVGRLTWNKGQDLVIRAVRHVRQLHPEIPIRCVFVGVGDMEEDLKRLAFRDASDIGTFEFVGYVENTIEYLWAADVFCLPSRLEGFALVVAEAMSAGVVPIRTPSGGASDQIIEGKTGFVVPFEDVCALSAAIIALASVDRRVEMAVAAVALAQERFSRDTMVAKVLAVYQALLP